MTRYPGLSDAPAGGSSVEPAPPAPGPHREQYHGAGVNTGRGLRLWHVAHR